MATRRFGDSVDVAKCSFIDESVRLFGNIKAEEGSSFWPYSVARSEMHDITVGRFTNIQDFVMLHVGFETGTHIGDFCSITHHVTLHGCTIGDHCLIGIHSTIMDGCVIGANSIVAGHSFLKEGTIIPENSVVMGTPGKVVKVLNCRDQNRMNALFYLKNAQAYAAGDHRAWSNPQLIPEMQELEKSLAE